MTARTVPDEVAIVEKLRAGRPVALAPEESARLVEAVREAVGVVLEKPAHQIGDDAKLFDDLGMDSIDVFDVLDQLAERFEANVALEDLPADLIRGKEGTTFRSFADGILAYFRTPPKASPPAAASGAGPA
ncbi:MAG: acyl carrier protein [SAR324 cluster bacterium]